MLFILLALSVYISFCLSLSRICSLLFLLLFYPLFYSLHSVPPSIFHLAPLPPPTLPPMLVTGGGALKPACPSGTSPCGDGNCFAIGGRCDGLRDCVGTGVDELGCPSPGVVVNTKSRMTTQSLKNGSSCTQCPLYLSVSLASLCFWDRMALADIQTYGHTNVLRKSDVRM